MLYDENDKWKYIDATLRLSAHLSPWTNNNTAINAIKIGVAQFKFNFSLNDKIRQPIFWLTGIPISPYYIPF